MAEFCDVGGSNNGEPDQNPQTSPREPAPYGLNNRKEKRLSSITPRKFSRFFTPRSQGSLDTSSSRKILFDITAPSNNRNGTQSSPLRPPWSTIGQENSPTSFTREMKRRKLLHATSASPEPISSPTCSQGGLSSILGYEQEIEERDVSGSFYARNPDGFAEQIVNGEMLRKSTARIAPLSSRGLAGGLLGLSLGPGPMHRQHHLLYPVSSWEIETSAFYSTAEDVHFSTGMNGLERCIPFCVASCNTNSLTAVGDEEGRVRLIESARCAKSSFKDVFLDFRPHSNAIIDLSFSADDCVLATASGDQTSRIVDMATQTTISILAKHSASVKQVRFQPGATNNSMLATSSRDGSVQIWDLRCKRHESPVQKITTPDPTATSTRRHRATAIQYSCAVSSIYDAHRPSRGRPPQPAVGRYGSYREDALSRVGDVSVTAIAFLPDGREHCLLTASEANATIKLWDLRSLRNTRRKPATPLSNTAQPKSHTQWRHFGINSLNLSTDGSRLFALCKDNTVYAYSTAHLILGRGSELSAGSAGWRRQPAEMQEGLGPLYGFRHPQLHATSFYVKSAVRPARNGKAEILAVGSSDGCIILFPTDERYHGQDIAKTIPDLSAEHPSRRKVGSGLGIPRFDDRIPISQNGTPLIRGHDREVGALTWTSDGELVTMGDDFVVRCWREGDVARDLRTGGEVGGRRWGCGWADVSPAQDEDDE